MNHPSNRSRSPLAVSDRLVEYDRLGPVELGLQVDRSMVPFVVVDHRTVGLVLGASVGLSKGRARAGIVGRTVFGDIVLEKPSVQPVVVMLYVLPFGSRSLVVVVGVR